MTFLRDTPSKGEAFQFVHESTDELISERQSRRRKVALVGLILIGILLVGTVLYFLGG